MAKVNDLITSRFKKTEKKESKMNTLAEMSRAGKLSSFSGVFRVCPLTENEEEKLKLLLREYSNEAQEIGSDLEHLCSITSEVKAINNQALILHGERIKRAQDLLKKYRDGAFSAWLVGAYGNRQTPYNFLQYYELYTGMSKALQEKVDEMPRQAVYTLATRNCPQKEKESIIQNYKGETKKELLALIREKFPLSGKDKRALNLSEQIINQLFHIESQMQNRRFKPSKGQRERILEVLSSIQKSL